ncbi:hypothetical protein [Streptomyces sp. NPDC001422]|uniref:hypothetical protein n=1 Tax=Streptomyces sp. NPDC001422 TaxID=3364575 RepID=UPI0036B1B871
MTYFSLRKRPTEPEEAEPEEAEEEQPEEPAETPAPARGPIITGLLGPGTWIAAKAGTGAAWGVHIVSGWAVVYYGGWVAVGVPIAWAVAVLAFVPREFLERAATAVEGLDVRRRKPSADAAPKPAPEGEREAVRRLLLDLIGEAHGVHLRTVLAHLQEHGQWEGRTVAELRVHLEALGIPVQPKVKVGGTPTRGVLRADLEALSPVPETSPSPAPSPPV